MKPELKAMVAQAAGGSPYYLEKVFLAALHWRGNELWYGPFQIGDIAPRGACYEASLFETFCKGVSTAKEGKEVLMAAAQEQIHQWFKEQS